MLNWLILSSIRPSQLCLNDFYELLAYFCRYFLTVRWTFTFMLVFFSKNFLLYLHFDNISFLLLIFGLFGLKIMKYFSASDRLQVWFCLPNLEINIYTYHFQYYYICKYTHPYYQARAKRGRPLGGRAERGLFTN